MSDLLRQYEDFISDLRHDYIQRGFRILDNNELPTELGYSPDLIVQRGNRITIIEVKAAGRISPTRIRDLRREAEKKGYDFDLKVLPRAPKKSKISDHVERVPQLISDAEKFLKQGRLDLATLFAWIAIEICIRSLGIRRNQLHEPIVASGDLVRAAVELELVSEDDLPLLRAAAELRNRVVHGFETEIPRELVARQVKLARLIADKAGLVAA